jgi:GNAT superfamily N-acetyltransferase
LERVYAELIAPNFSWWERDELEGIRRYMRYNTDSRAGSYRGLVAVADSRILGATLYAILPWQVCFMTGQYTAVAPEYRGRGLGSELSVRREDDALRWAELNGYAANAFSIISLNDVPLANSTSHGDRYAPTHEGMWRRLGYRRIDFPYVELPLHEGFQPSRAVHLRIKGHSPEYRHRRALRAEEMKAIIDGCTRFRCDARGNSSFPDYVEMMALLSDNRLTAILDE